MADGALTDPALETRRANLLALFDMGVMSEEELESESALVDHERTNFSDESGECPHATLSDRSSSAPEMALGLRQSG